MKQPRQKSQPYTTKTKVDMATAVLQQNYAVVIFL